MHCCFNLIKVVQFSDFVFWYQITYNKIFTGFGKSDKTLRWIMINSYPTLLFSAIPETPQNWSYLTVSDEFEPNWLELKDFLLGSWPFLFSSKKNFSSKMGKYDFFFSFIFLAYSLYFRFSLWWMILFLVRITNFCLKQKVWS